jgi:hypothetical protein
VTCLSHLAALKVNSTDLFCAKWKGSLGFTDALLAGMSTVVGYMSGGYGKGRARMSEEGKRNGKLLTTYLISSSPCFSILSLKIK